ncbi:MAG: tetratricopeptide repeat protein [Acidobacteria bacterium]|nr:tetratricopeptide repeat protein [Acidobacteriota bacterium]
MKQKLSAALVVAFLVAAPAPASAANKEHQQLMADLRILQEQAQLLQNMLEAVTEAMKAMDGRVTQRVDQLSSVLVKAFADQKLSLDNLSNDVRVIREKLDDNNVRIGSLTQEVSALRQSLQQMTTRPAAPAEPDTSAAGGATTPAAGPPPGSAVNASPQKLWDAAQADYFAGQYDLAVIGFGAYITSFPKSDMADDAQVYICKAYLNDHKDDKAAEACDVAIRTYPGGNAIPDAYYGKGLALKNLRQLDRAREAFETVVKNYPDSNAATLARQALVQLGRQ